MPTGRVAINGQQRSSCLERYATGWCPFPNICVKTPTVTLEHLCTYRKKGLEISGSCKPGGEGSLDFFKGFFLYSFPQQRLLFSPHFVLIKWFCQNGDVRYPNHAGTCGPEKFLNLVSDGGNWGWVYILPFLRAELILSLGIWKPRYLTFWFLLFKKAPLWHSSILNPQALLGSHWGFSSFLWSWLWA